LAPGDLQSLQAPLGGLELRLQFPGRCRAALGLRPAAVQFPAPAAGWSDVGFVDR